MIASENRKRFSPPIDADTPGDFFRRSRRCDTSTLFPDSIQGRFEKSCDKIAQPDWLILLAMSEENRGKGHTWRMPAILFADRGHRRKSLHRAHLAIFSDSGDRRIKSPGVSPALAIKIPDDKSFRIGNKWWLGTDH